MDLNNLQPVITESPEQPTLTVTETIPTMIIPDTTIAISKVSETTVETPKLNESIFSQQNSQEAVSGEVTEDQARSDPPLNTSSDNPYYSNSNNNWVINESGHDWIMDLDLNHNNGSGVTFNLSTKTFSNFGSTFAILINASDVYFDGMGAILDGGGKTQYGILVNNQSIGSYDTFSSDSSNALSGINIKNITLINFLNTGIFFNNVIDTLSGSGSIPEITIKNVNYQQLGLIPDVFRKLGIIVEKIGDDIHIPGLDHYEVESFMDGSIMTIADSPWPGFTPDLISIVLVVATQARGSVLIHQKMFESRLFFVDKLIDMGAKIILCDPHRATVIGLDHKYPLRGIRMSSPDIRAGVALLIAALSAEGRSIIDNIEQIDRGYQEIDKRLRILGAEIQRI